VIWYGGLQLREAIKSVSGAPLCLNREAEETVSPDTKHKRDSY
jgi:hypothetical protein